MSINIVNQFAIQPVANTKKVTVQLPYGDWFRVRPLSTLEHRRFFITWNASKATWFLIDPQIAAEYKVKGLVKAYIVEAMFSNGRTFLIPLTLPIPGQLNNWYPTLTNAIQVGVSAWVGIERNDEEKYFNVEKSDIDFGEPVWSDLAFEELIAKAFKGRVIKTPAAVKKLRTET